MNSLSNCIALLSFLAVSIIIRSSNINEIVCTPTGIHVAHVPYMYHNISEMAVTSHNYHWSSCCVQTYPFLFDVKFVNDEVFSNHFGLVGHHQFSIGLCLPCLIRPVPSTGLLYTSIPIPSPTSIRKAIFNFLHVV